MIDFIFEVLWILNMLVNFFKRTPTHTTLQSIIWNYLTGTFIFDLISIFPVIGNLVNKIFLKYYWLRSIRIVHVFIIIYPFELLLQCIMSKHSKKRQSDYINFATLIVLILYLSHLMACVWIALGLSETCDHADLENENCT